MLVESIFFWHADSYVKYFRFRRIIIVSVVVFNWIRYVRVAHLAHLAWFVYYVDDSTGISPNYKTVFVCRHSFSRHCLLIYLTFHCEKFSLLLSQFAACAHKSWRTMYKCKQSALQNRRTGTTTTTTITEKTEKKMISRRRKEKESIKITVTNRRHGHFSRQKLWIESMAKLDTTNSKPKRFALSSNVSS